MSYIANNWQNFGRPLTSEELDEIRSKISGVHFSKEAHDQITLQMLYCAEALQRDLEHKEAEVRERLAVEFERLADERRVHPATVDDESAADHFEEAANLCRTFTTTEEQDERTS